MCCSGFQNTALINNFGQIDIVFGSANGGCDVCAVNLKRFWCAYTCSPEQANFTVVTDYVDAKSYQKNQIVQVLNTTLTVESSTACALYESCKGTAYVGQVSAMQSPAGFLNFQGENAVDQGNQVIHLAFTNDPSKGLFIPDLDACTRNISSPFRGFEVRENCTCNSCRERCSSTFSFREPGVLEGFNYWLVGGFWAGLLVLVGVVEWHRQRKGKEYKLI